MNSISEQGEYTVIVQPPEDLMNSYLISTLKQIIINYDANYNKNLLFKSIHKVTNVII